MPCGSSPLTGSSKMRKSGFRTVQWQCRGAVAYRGKNVFAFSGILQSDKLKQTEISGKKAVENLKLLAEIFFPLSCPDRWKGFHHSTDAFPRVLVCGCECNVP